MLKHCQDSMQDFSKPSQDDLLDSFSMEEFDQSISLLIVMCCSLFVSWNAAFFMFKNKFPRGLDKNKRFYVIANCSKALCLATMCMHSSFFQNLAVLFKWQAYQGETLSNAQAMWVKRTSALYVASDVVSMLIVDLPKTTWVHHIVTICLALALFLTKLNQGNVTIMIAVYGAWSALAFPVNLFLALRNVIQKSTAMIWFGKLAAIQYSLVCACNWSWHLWWFANQILSMHQQSMFSIASICFYALAVALVSNDDIVLMRWLWRYKYQ